ncbi:VPLPA-CTERM sorting domain-containing protein [Frigidibacter sp. MR17.14]|uniref:VPLPA-CTERM sorting domain-containing protein n=1 Tax=Frigidibacter sp. MR17.14 TaxID=3126509 RepID=UPI003013187F
MKKVFLAAAFSVAASAAGAATIYSGEIPVADYITIGDADWAWASPCGADIDSCANFDIAEQATYGWRLPDAKEIADYILPSVSDFVASFFKDDIYACASGWFNSSWTHCDVSDALAGFVWNVDGGYFSETFVIRTAGGAPGPAPVPVPAAGLMMVAGLGGLAALRRRRAA